MAHEWTEEQREKAALQGDADWYYGKTYPNPGSAEAQKAGCTCAVVDNYYGAGLMYRVDRDG